MTAEISDSAPAARVAAVVPPQRQRKVIAFAILCLGCFIAFLDIQIVSASIEEIGGGLSASPDDMSWVQTSYLIGDIIVIPLSAWLSRVLSTRWLVTIGAAGFTVASMLCGMAWDIRSMIVFRALQGLCGGVLIPTTFTAAIVLFQGKQKTIAASCVSIAAGLAPALGPVIGGWITGDWSWHWLFYINIVPGTAVAVLAPVFVRMDGPDLALLKGADYIGMIMLAVCLGCLDYVLEDGARWEWFSDATIRACAWVAAFAGAGFVIRSLTHAHPIVDLRAFANRNFCLGCWFSFMTGVGIFGLTYLIPLFLGHVRGFIAWQIGDAILWAGPFQLAAVLVYSLLASRIDPRLLLMTGLVCFGLSMWLFTPIMNQWGWEEMLLPIALRGRRRLRPWPWRKSSNARGVGTTSSQKVRITHPFHPLCGRKVELISRRRHWGEDRLLYSDESGRLRWVASAWTDIDPADEFRRIAAGRAAFRTVDLLELCRRLDRLAAG